MWGHFISCRMLRELSQLGRGGVASLGFRGLEFLVLRRTLSSLLIHARSPGLHSERLAFQGGSRSSLHQCEKLELEYEFHLGPGLIVSEPSAHLPAGGELVALSGLSCLAGTWGRVAGSEAPAICSALCGCPETFANVCFGVGKCYLRTSTSQGHQAG